MSFTVRVMLAASLLLVACPALMEAEDDSVVSNLNSFLKETKPFIPPKPRSEGAQGVAPQAPSGHSGEDGAKTRYQAAWESLETRPLPQWYDEAKIGLFVHWGVYSVPSFMDTGSNGLAEWFWYYWRTGPSESKYHTQNAAESVRNFMANNFPPDFKYTDFASKFTAEFFDPSHWVDVFKSSGARYILLTSKHHDGFTLWPSSKSWNWNSVDNGPHRDLVGDLAEEIRKSSDLRFGIYHSLYEWYNPLYLEDKANGFATQNYVKEKLQPELEEVVKLYKPEVVWADGQWEASCDYFNCTQFMAWLYNDSPVKDSVVTNDRWGKDTTCKYGGFLTCTEKTNADTRQAKKWENSMTLDYQSWGYRRNAVLKDYVSMERLLKVLAETLSNGGNVLLNIGATSDGRLSPIFEERLRQLGGWLQVNGEAVYGTHKWHVAQDPQSKQVFYTAKTTNDLKGDVIIYAFILEWPKSDQLDLAAPVAGNHTTVTWLGYREGQLNWQRKTGGGMLVTLPKISMGSLPCQWAWTLKLRGLDNSG